jgi:hypothetical protein
MGSRDIYLTLRKFRLIEAVNSWRKLLDSSSLKRIALTFEIARSKLASEKSDGPPSGNPMKQTRGFPGPEHIPSFYLIQLPILDMQQNVEDDILNVR